MPVVEIRAPYAAPEGALPLLATKIAKPLGIQADRVSIFWHELTPTNAYHTAWSHAGPAAPHILITCRSVHTTEKIRTMITALKTYLEATLACSPQGIFIAVRRIRNDEIHAYGQLWE